MVPGSPVRERDAVAKDVGLFGHFSTSWEVSGQRPAMLQDYG